MKSVLASVIALGLATSCALAQFTINTPASAVVCQPLLISWTGGSPPYFLVWRPLPAYFSQMSKPVFSILPGNQPQAQALVTFPSTSATSVTWLVDIAAQTSLGLSLRDSTGAVVQSAPFSVQTGPDSSCVGKSSSITFGSTAAPGSTTTAATTTGVAPVTTAQSTPNTSSTSPASGTTRASAGTTTTSSTPARSAGASRVTGQVAAAGIIGAAMVALLG